MRSIRQEPTRLETFKDVIKPKSELASTLSVILKGSSQSKWDIFQVTRQKPLSDPQPVLHSRIVEVAARYSKNLGHRRVLNAQQADIVERSLTLTGRIFQFIRHLNTALEGKRSCKSARSIKGKGPKTGRVFGPHPTYFIFITVTI